MKKNVAVVVTSISEPNEILKNLASGCRKNGYQYIIIGDKKSPVNFSIDGCEFLDVKQQQELGLRLSRICPENHYSRKNIGYLVAIRNGCNVIVETDDDNSPYSTFWEIRPQETIARSVNIQGWYNAYSAFTDIKIWPRGFPLEFVTESKEDGNQLELKQTHSPIQQGLADGNPDVDAVYRMTHQLPLNFNLEDDIILAEGTWCPFNSQNTTWFKEAFPLLYLPSFCSFRMTDIWRSFIAQRIAWTCEWEILFHKATVFQERNEHSLLKDFEDEIPGYLGNAKICKELGQVDLERGPEHIHENLHKCYKVMVDNGHVDKSELQLLDAWLKDISELS